MRRAAQRDETCNRIIEAAIEAFAEHGYGASSTRDIATRAGVTQGLLTYHFESKDALWRAAADRIFGRLVGEIPDPPKMASRAARREGARAAIRSFVRFAAAQPALFSFMVDAGKHADERMAWLVETHLARRFADIARFAGLAFPGSGPKLAPHFYYALAGAASLIFAVAPECAELTGRDPTSRTAIDRHADLIALLFVPE